MFKLRTGLRGYRLIILAVVGALLAIFGALWMAVIFPALDKMPGDYEQNYYFEGTFSVMNPATQQLDTFPIEQTREIKAVGSKDGALLINVSRTVINSATGADLTAIYGEESILAVDARTLEFQQEVDEQGRWGQWSPPRPLAVGDSFDLWHAGARQPLTANYVRSEDFRGLGVMVFMINEENINIGTEPQSGMPLLLSTTVTMWIEPSSGTPVYNESVTTTSIDMMGITQVPVMISSLSFTEETIVDLMGTARSASWLLLWFRTLVPWIAIGFGCLLVGISAVTVAIRSLRKARTDRPTERPRSVPMDI